MDNSLENLLQMYTFCYSLNINTSTERLTQRTVRQYKQPIVANLATAVQESHQVDAACSFEVKRKKEKLAGTSE